MFFPKASLNASPTYFIKNHFVKLSLIAKDIPDSTTCLSQDLGNPISEYRYWNTCKYCLVGDYLNVGKKKKVLFTGICQEKAQQIDHNAIHSVPPP